jgi:SNF2 family DNA or RNA helicase
VQRKKLNPHEYQMFVVEEAVRRLTDEQLEGVALFLGLGLGKTIATLMIYQELKRRKAVKKGLLILAPKRVCEITWPDEVEKWTNFKDLSWVNLAGKTPAKRKELLMSKADVCLSTVDSTTWLLSMFNTTNKLKSLPYDMLVCDESTAFKTWGSGRTKALRKLQSAFRKTLLLSATPRANGVLDLFAQFFVLNGGKSLGKTISAFKNKYGYTGGYKGYDWIPHGWADDAVNELIAPYTIRMDSIDHLDLPSMTFNNIYCEFDSATRKKYKQLEDEMWLEFESGGELIPLNAGVRYQSCKQFTGGGVYVGPKDDRQVERLHDEKLNLLSDTVEECGSAFVAYQYQWEHDVIQERLIKAGHRVASLNGNTKAGEAGKIVARWNKNELDVLLCQPQGVSHGLNLQYGPARDIIWFGLTDQPEVYDQFNGRVYRQGVDSSVRVHHLLVKSTVDILVAARTTKKLAAQKSMLDFLKTYQKDNDCGGQDHGRLI